MSVMELEREQALAHFGVKGMKWGVRKASTSLASRQLNSPAGRVGKKLGTEIKNRRSASNSSEKKGLSDGQKKALKIGGGILAVAGAAAVVTVMAKNGKLPAGVFAPKPKMSNLGLTAKDQAQRATYFRMSEASKKGAAQVKKFDQKQWDTDVSSLISSMQAESARFDQRYRQQMNSLPRPLTDPRSRRLAGMT